MSNNCTSELNNRYRNVFIVDSMSDWNENKKSYDQNSDLVLTYDFELKIYIDSIHGDVFFIDHMIDSERMHKNNFLIYEFFKTWFLDKNDKDIFTYKDVPFGFSLRLEVWNDFTYYVRTFICLSSLHKIEISKLYLISNDAIIVSALEELNISFERQKSKVKIFDGYYFPIAQWMDEQIRPNSVRAFLYKMRELVTAWYGFIMPIIDKIFRRSIKKRVFIQEYHPTRKILANLRSNDQIEVLLVNFSRSSTIMEKLSERLIPINGSLKKYEQKTEAIMSRFKLTKDKRLILDDDSDITDKVYSIITDRISNRIPSTLRTLDSCIGYLEKHSIDLVVLIANIGHVATLLDCVCRQKTIPSYLIINGLLLSPFDDESKYATVINSYSESIKDNYFRGMNNIVCLGDPRMDAYSTQVRSKVINRKLPRVTIGAAAFSNVDLNSYVAVEFDFIYEILSAFKTIISRGIKVDLTIKARPNGYKQQYDDFVQEFFPELSIEIVSTLPMQSVLEKSDFYITTYSQTLFEASCLGIPCVYYKKDKEILDAPFNYNSELVTVDNVEDLIQAFYDFQIDHNRYKPFLDRKVMEKYIGPLDGKNLRRNVDFIYKLLEGKSIND